MARVLILELDPVFAAVIEDRLLVAGHEVTLATDPAVAVSAATEGQADLLIMEMQLPGVSGIEIVRQLRQQGETRSLPIVALSANQSSDDRIAALRAGVDEFLSKPCDPEELLLRLGRFLDSRGTTPQIMQGDLASHRIWELLQYIQQANKSGDLMIYGKKGSGQVHLDRGRVRSARWQKLRDRDALLAISDMKEGRFQLATEVADETVPLPDDALRIQDILIQAAWIEDQLAKRRQYAPATGAPLELTARAAPQVEEAFEFLPIDAILRRVARGGVRLYDLMAEENVAPSKIRLAVAWLVEQGAVVPSEQALQQQAMSTSEISSSVVFDIAIHGLLAAARGAGFDVSALPYLLLAEPGTWPELQQLPASVPGFLRNDALRGLVERTQQGQGGSATFKTDVGKLSLHVQPLDGAKQLVEAIVPVCAGVLLWLDDAGEKDLIRRIVDRLEAAHGPAVGILVARSDATRQTATELIAKCHKWKVSSHAPRSLLGVLRLLHPPAR